MKRLPFRECEIRRLEKFFKMMAVRERECWCCELKASEG
jgi:hypothetical protein